MLDDLLGLDRGKLGDAAEWGFRWAGLPPLWVVVLILIPAVIVLTFLVYRREGRTASRGMKFFLGTLRAILILLALVILFEPILTVDREYPRESHIALVVDESLSMGLVDAVSDPEKKAELAWATGITERKARNLSAGEETDVNSLRRIDIVNRALSNTSLFEDSGKKVDLAAKLSKKFTVKLFSFAATAKLAPLPVKIELKNTFTSTAIGDSLTAVLNAMRGHQLAAIVLVSDGCSNVGTDPIAVSKIFLERGLAVPVYTVAPGVAGEPRDIELVDIEAPEAVQARDYAVFDVVLKSKGLEGESISVVLSEVGREVAEENIVLESEKEQRVALRYKPLHPGEYLCTVSTPVLPGEIVKENNKLSHLLKVVDEKTRVLFVDNYPRWEYRKLKNALIRDHSVEAWCFLQSADPDFPQECTAGLEPLVELPRTMQELCKYDVVIFGDVDPFGAGFSNVPGVAEEIHRNIVSFVEEVGGGFTLIAGKRDSPKRYRMTELMKILPVVLEDQELLSMDISLRTEPFRLKVTPQGRDHPIMKLDHDSQKNLNLWEDPDGSGDGLAGLYWFYPVKRAKSSATVLAVHPRESNKYGNLPVITVQPCGRGRSLFVATDETWSWRYIVGDKYFYTFWRAAIRYLRGGKLVGGKRFTVKTDKPKYSIGETVKITARMLDQDYRPLADPSCPANIAGPHAEEMQVQMKAMAERPGTFETEFKPDDVGFYKIVVGSELFGDERDRGFASFAVHVPVKEFENPMIDKKVLETLAANTKGVFVPITEIQRLPDVITARGTTYAYETKEDELWDSPLAILLFVGVIATEWLVRKRARLI
jgi:hypothetical protein